MRFANIEISGVKKIVFNRKHWWIRFSDHWRLAIRSPDRGDWTPIAFEGSSKTHEEMMKIVNHLKRDKRYRMWFHVDTLNIVNRGDDRVHRLVMALQESSLSNSL